MIAMSQARKVRPLRGRYSSAPKVAVSAPMSGDLLMKRSLSQRHLCAVAMAPLTLGLIAGLVGLPSFAAAQSNGNSVSEIVVTANPLGTAGAQLSHTPGNAQVVGPDAISEQSPTNVADLLNANIGSASISGGSGNPYQSDINFRGFQATSLLGAPVGLAVYFDGVRANEPFGSIVNWDLIPVNALRDVQVQPDSNAVFGLNALGGAIVAQTRTGADSPGVSISGLYGSFARRAASLTAGGSDPAGLDYFLAGNYDQQNGFREHSGSEVKQLYGKLRWHSPDDKTRIALSGAYADTSLSGTQSLPEDMLSTPKASYTWPDNVSNHLSLANLQANHWLNDTNQLSGQIYFRQSNATSFNSNAGLDDGCFNPDGSVATTGAGALKCANAAPDGTAVNAVTSANALAMGFGRWTNTINSSLVVSSTKQDTTGGSAQWTNSDRIGQHDNSLVLGARYDQSNITYAQNAELAQLINYGTFVIPNRAYGFTANGLAPSTTNLPTFSGGNILDSVDLRSRVTEFSVFFADTFDLTPRLNITASGSFDRTTVDQTGTNNQYLNDDGGYSWTDNVTGVGYYNPGFIASYRYANSAAGVGAAPVGVPAGAIAGPETHSLDGSHTYQRFDPRIGFNFNIDPAIGLFGSYSQSMRAPTSIELSCADPNSPCALPTGFNGDPDLKAVTASTYELGARGGAGVFSWNAAVYDSRLQNDIQFIATSSSFGYFFNAGATERRGVELGGKVDLGHLALSADYGYVEALYRTPFTTADGEAVQKGNFIPGIPKNTFKFQASYPVTKRFRVGADVIVNGSQYAHGNEDNSDPDGKVAGYTVINLDADYHITNALKLSLNMDNVFNERYYTYGLSGQTSIYTLASEPFLTQAAPRGAWVRLTYDFGGAAHRD
jgi:outer membrane receptor protein involved in Fe transport